MPKVTNAFTSYLAVGNREDLSNEISNISPTDTPFISAIGKRSITNKLWSWQTESLSSVDLNNAQQDGFTSVTQAPTPTVLQTGMTQIFTKSASVSGSQEAITSAGRASETGHAVALRAAEVKRDVEAILSQNQAMALGDDSSAVRKTRAFEHTVQSAVSTGSGYAAPGSATASMTDGTTRALTEAMFLDVMQAATTNGGKPNLMIASPAQRRKISTFQGRTATQVPLDKNQVVSSVSILETDFGVVKVCTSLFSRSRTVMLVDPSKARLAVLRPWKVVDLAKTGDADTKMLVAEMGLQIDNEQAHGKLADLA